MTHPPHDQVHASLEIEKMLHELQTHQIELEMQNEELRRIQADLDATRERYFDLYTLAPVGYCTVTEQGLIKEANLTAAILLGMNREALINRPFSQFILTQDQDSYYLHRRAMVGDGVPHGCELQMAKNDGTPFWVHLATTTSQTGGMSEYRIAMSDVTERKRIEKTLLEREAQYRQIMETAREGIGVTDANWRITFVNNRMAELLSYRPAEMVGRLLEDFLFAEDKRHSSRQMREREQGLDGFHECRFRGKDGGAVWATVSATAQKDGDGKFAGSFFMFIDITERKAAEASSKAKSDFLALVSHEIRTPLNALMGFSSLARKTSDPVMLQQYLDIIDQSSRSLMDLVNDILDMSKIEAGQVRLDSIPFNLVDTIDLLVWQYKPLAIQKKLDFQVSCATDLPTWISGDPLRLRQILVNLVTNSIKFTESGSITLTVTATASTQDEADISIRFAVHDTGIGIANDNLAFLFQPFWQNDSSSTRKYGGTGLGLAIVQSLAQLMRGRVEVTSVPGRGSCFTVALPFRIATPPAYQKIAPPIIVPLAVLVVEDNGFNRRFLGDLLTSLGHTVTLAENGFQALELTKQHCYDCIILDVRMPDMDGIELTRRLRAREKKQNLRPVPILACTGDTGSHTEQQCLAAGMKAVLAKPLNLDKFAQILSELGSSSLLGKTPAPPCQIADWIVADMGDNPARIEEYLQLLQDDIRGALDRLEQAIATDDRSALKAIAHTLKGLCGHLREKEPELLALRLHNGSLTWSRAELRNEATSLRSVCAQLLLNGRGDGK